MFYSKLIKPSVIVFGICMVLTACHYRLRSTNLPDWLENTKMWKADSKNYQKIKGTYALDYFLNQVYVTKDYYKGAPFRKCPDDLVYFNWGEKLVFDSTLKYVNHTLYIPQAARLYLGKHYTDTAFSVGDNIERWKTYQNLVDHLPAGVFDKLIKPFYFRKYEVTNWEYRTFMEDVSGENVNSFLLRHLDSSTFMYTFAYPDNKYLKDYGLKTINILPLDGILGKDFYYLGSSPTNTHYLTSYGNWPVCGITYWQALAYLDWKTKKYQDHFDSLHVAYKISFDLPSDLEWEIVTLSAYEQEMFKMGAQVLYDEDWICDLSLTHKDDQEGWTLNVALKRKNADNYMKSFQQEPVNYLNRHRQKINSREFREGKIFSPHVDFLGITFMDGNVSEWMQETYADNWLPAFNAHQQMLLKNEKESEKLSAKIENFYNSRNDTDGRLVRGGNFNDQRYSWLRDKNPAGIMLKRFVSPWKAHSTIGFRYVVRVEKKP